MTALAVAFAYGVVVGFCYTVLVLAAAERHVNRKKTKEGQNAR